MSLEASLIILDEELKQLEQSLDNLLWAVIQGQPQTGEGHALLDHYEAATSDLMSSVRAAKSAIEESRKTLPHRLDLTRQALTTGQTQVNQLLALFYHDLASFEQIDALRRLARARGGEWAKWVQGVRDALDRCPQPLHKVGQTLLNCWQDLVEQTSRLSVSVQATSIGQEFHVVQKETDEAQVTT